jgi:hypothetical protein
MFSQTRKGRNKHPNQFLMDYYMMSGCDENNDLGMRGEAKNTESE